MADEGVEGIVTPSPLRGKLRARDQVIDQREHPLETGVDGVDIHGYRDCRAASDPRRLSDGRGIVPVDVQQPCSGNLI